MFTNVECSRQEQRIPSKSNTMKLFVFINVDHNWTMFFWREGVLGVYTYSEKCALTI